ncbi:2d62d6fb-086f-44d6-92dd-b42bb11a1f9d [Thermothielavioides terrestris]|uniref:2d62d6fb-086f-44d6-92dd-b42bb11a1f9d n=1 Tax=Thermothielavioides terrestris TaxID=2587410 RepID=A0A446B9G3_9PEZI|nr:2d62d6fb-086f-44d6-92dd-b42bb11a1f9d [Thermothielavioides terrestris]
MASPSQIAGPNDRSVPNSSGGAFPPREQTRPSDSNNPYTETLPNPPPEFLGFEPANRTENLAATLGVGGGDGAHEGATELDTFPSIGRDNDGSKERVFHEAVYVEPPPTPWYKTISKGRWLGVAICLVGSTAVILAILGALNRLSGQSPYDSPDTDSNAPFNDISPTATRASTNPTSSDSSNTASTAAPTANPTAQAINCTDPTSFVSPVTWIGAQSSYRSDFASSSSAAQCCDSCARHTPGCAGWLFNASSPFTPCTKIVLTGANRARADAACPDGYTGTTYFAKGGAGGESLATLRVFGVEQYTNSQQ